MVNYRFTKYKQSKNIDANNQENLRKKEKEEIILLVYCMERPMAFRPAQ